MYADKPPCPVHGIRFMTITKGTHGQKRKFICRYCNYKNWISENRFYIPVIILAAGLHLANLLR